MQHSTVGPSLPSTMILKSRYVVPVDAPVIENGAVAVRQGCVVAVASARDLRAFQDGEVIDYGHAVICPGFVNAHTHLELSLLAGQVPPTPDFIDWLRRLMARSDARPRSREQLQRAVRAGLAQSLSAGVTTVGDITRTPQWTREALGESPVSGVSFGEVIAIGKRRSRLAECLDAAATPTKSLSHNWLCLRSDRLESRSHRGSGIGSKAQSLRLGISPHAPYSVEPDAMRACAIRAHQLDVPLCMHLAETADEEPFTRSAAGRFAEFLRELDVWDRRVSASGCGPIELAVKTGVLGHRTLIAHANYVSDADVALIAASGASVAYCPRTHRAFGHPPHRFREMLAAGINVCVGTDSLASNPSLSILEELRFVKRQYPNLPADELLAMGTLRGARALGFADVVGSITVGKRADLVVVPLHDTTDATRWDAIFESGADPTAVYVSGVQPTGAWKLR